MNLPTIADFQSGMDLLASLPLANPVVALRDLENFFDSMAQTPPGQEGYLELLEQSRIPLCFITEDLARNYIGKALPLSDEDERFFSRVTGLLYKLVFAYSRCVRPETARKSEMDHARLALVLHRSLYYAKVLVVEYHRVYRELRPGLWKAIHTYYDCAEKHGVATHPVRDELAGHEEAIHCSSAFFSLLLTELASPYSLSTSYQSLIRSWSDRWAHLVDVHTISAEANMPNFVIDLRQDVALSEGKSDVQHREHLRKLNNKRLAKHLKQVSQQLQQKIAPAEIGLGEACTPEQCRHLLSRIVNPWLQIRAPRKHRRRSTDGIATVCVGFEAIHFLIASGISTFQPVPGKDESLPFGKEHAGFTLDPWQITNQSASGFRLVRQRMGKSVRHGQLMAIRPHEGEPFLLGCINWLMQESSGSLVVGVEVFAGLPQAVAVRPPASAAGEPFRQAFLLPAIPALGSKESLLLQQGSYRSRRLLEIRSPDKHSLKTVELGRILNSGYDFERARFADRKEPEAPA